MRCNNCGWNNPDDLDKCQKCNQPLQVMSVADNAVITVKSKNEDGVASCPNCGYPCAENTETCPNCGMHLVNDLYNKPSKQTPVPSGQKTVADISEFVNLESINKKTVLVFDPKEEKVNADRSNTDCNEYVFECMDKPDNPSVRIITGMSLDIEKDDIILLGGLRFVKV